MEMLALTVREITQRQMNALTFFSVFIFWGYF